LASKSKIPPESAIALAEVADGELDLSGFHWLAVFRKTGMLDAIQMLNNQLGGAGIPIVIHVKAIEQAG
jgi:hypothetical protein